MLNTYLRLVEKPRLARTADHVLLRRNLERQARFLFHAPRGTQLQWQVLEADSRRIDALEVVPATMNTDAVILYIHGGGFVFGSPRTHAAMLGQLARRSGARAVLPRYSLAPEAPHPAAVTDVRTAWEGLIASGVAPDRIVVGGDSAGGALALGLMADLIRDHAAQPAGVFCFSPLTDLTHSGQSFRANRKSEVVLPAGRAGEMDSLYLAGQASDDPRVSPLFARFDGAAPVWITVGDTEILRDDARGMADCLTNAGVDLTFAEQHDLPHVWPLFHNILPEARATLDDAAAWIRRRLDLPDES